MTAVQQQVLQQPLAMPSFEETVPLMITFAPNWPIRTVIFRIAGTALILGSAGMWVLPGTSVDPDLIVMKLGLSFFLLLSGMVLLMMHHVDNQPDAYFDPIRREVRVLQKNNRGRPQTVLRRSYESLGSVKFHERQMDLYDVDGSILMKLPLASPEVRQALRNQLSGMVNIAS
ncbi:hypothetical protein TRL7639_02408 [Falsiruegeria litorea R37]|uniref:Uncharacterized protein n=2 Tax=Falsiruegeria litorea TaxID=1280831 RepID=A0A1Y5SPL3_9RHOB|nr:hypothetical protein TRL7639_02408 [Falsiruegeria litorea R37]